MSHWALKMGYNLAKKNNNAKTTVCVCVLNQLSTLGVMVDGLQQQVDEYPQLLRLAASQEAQDDGGARGGAGLALELAARFAAQTSKQDPGRASTQLVI